MNIEKALNDRLCQLLCIPTDQELIVDNDIGEAYDMDSLDFVEFIMDVETEFNIQIPDTDARQLDTLRKIADYIRGKTQLPSMIPREFEIRDAFEVYSEVNYPTKTSSTKFITWDRSRAIRAVKDSVGLSPPRLRWLHIRVIYLKGSWVKFHPKPLTIQE